MAKNDKTPTPMDDGAPERKVGVAATNRQRVCYSLVTLINEINALFPGAVEAEYKQPDGRNTLLAAAFDLSNMDEDDRVDLTALLSLLGDPAHNVDKRIQSITVDDEEQSAYIEMRSNARTQDSRDSFGLAAALEVLAGEPAEEGYTNEDDEGSW